MTCTLYDIAISITLQAPYLVHGNDPGRFGLDATLLKSHKGQPILPGTLVAGRIAETWQTHGENFDNANADTWFGKGTDGEQHRARLMVSDLVLSMGDLQASEITRIQIDEDMGSVKQGAMLVIEQIARPGAELEFVGTWKVWALDSEIKTLRNQIHAALALQTQWGAYRTIGFGRMVKCMVNYIQAKPTTITCGLTEESKIRFGLSFNEPICVSSTSRRGNVFTSGEVIPGNTILGALAQTLLHKYQAKQLSAIKKVSKLANYFDQLRCTHALPSKKGGGRPMPLPLSLISVTVDQAIEIKDAYLCATAPKLNAAPTFQTDWKGQAFAEAEKKQGWIKTQRYLRVRTAMKDGKADEGKSDKDKNDVENDNGGKLFAYECIYSKDAEWQFDLDLTGVDDAIERAMVANEIKSIMEFGLAPIGKTDARAEVHVLKTTDVWPSNEEGFKQDELVNMVLRTDALLFPTSDVAENTNIDLKNIYKAAFESLDKDGAIELSHFFASQKLLGGNYFYKKYQQNNKNIKKNEYQPLVLTEAGSVFVFKIKNAEKAKELLDGWNSNGLPLPEKVGKEHGKTWSDHPYIPKNGYGEVVIKPKKMDFKLLTDQNNQGENNDK